MRRPPGRFEAIPDDLTAQEIAEQAASAAKGTDLIQLKIRHKMKSPYSEILAKLVE